jgi:hypothetical protein
VMRNPGNHNARQPCHPGNLPDRACSAIRYSVPGIPVSPEFPGIPSWCRLGIVSPEFPEFQQPFRANTIDTRAAYVAISRAERSIDLHRQPRPPARRARLARWRPGRPARRDHGAEQFSNYNMQIAIQQ